MDMEDQELGPFKSVPDELVLAATQRARLHVDGAVRRSDIAEHLGFVHSAATSRRLRPQLESLRAAGLLAAPRRHGAEDWSLTRKGRGRIGAARRSGKLGELPESPQHRRWRHAREAAQARYDEFRTLLYVTLEAAEDAADSAIGPGSQTWCEMGERLAAAFWLMGSVTYCRDEWPEPDDARGDRAEGDARRRIADWPRQESIAKGGSDE